MIQLILVVGFILFVIMIEKIKEDAYDQLQNRRKMYAYIYNNYQNYTKVFVSSDGKLGICFSFKDQLGIVVANNNNSYQQTSLFKFSDVSYSEISINNQTVKTNQIGRAIIGGALFGVVGAATGFLSANSLEKITGISVKICINYSIVELKLLSIETTMNSPLYNAWYNEALVLQSFLTNIINNTSQLQKELIAIEEKSGDTQKWCCSYDPFGDDVFGTYPPYILKPSKVKNVNNIEVILEDDSKHDIDMVVVFDTKEQCYKQYNGLIEFYQKDL